MPKVVFEMCVDTPHGLRVAKSAGADRVELCAALAAGGLTPTRGMMRLAREIDMPAHVMIRPRDGDFCFTQDEVDLMLDDIALAQQEKMQGVVIGATTSNGTLDFRVLRALIAAANGMDVTLHRAFDVTPDPFEALETAVELGINRILSSGCQKNACDGKDLLADLAKLAAGRIEIMPGSGVNAESLSELAAVMPLTSLHTSCATNHAQSPKMVESLGFSGPGGRRDADEKIARKMARACANLERVTS